MRWWVTDWLDAAGPVFLVSWITWVVVSIVLHELAHGWMALRCGDDTPRYTGHMTANPFVHIPVPWAWVMFALFGFTWGLMPVNPANFRGRYDDTKVAFAGPLMNLILAVFCLVADAAWLTFATNVQDPLHLNLHKFLWIGLMINLMGFCFNLLPVPPLDGSRIASDLIPAYNRMLYKIQTSEGGAIVAMIAFTVLFMAGGRVVWPFVMTVAAISSGGLTAIMGGTFRDPFA
ncbi:MAG TPA: site-2 protease family protein [Phycisphaerales bacterium]|nr:site-2 protease family protein [Phycisphaerales bacterium]